MICSRALKTCAIKELAVDSTCGGDVFSGSVSGNMSPFGTEDDRVSGETYTLISNLGLTTTALTTLIMFQLKYAFYWYKYRNRTMLLTVYMERSVAEADNTISLRGRSRQPSMWSNAGTSMRGSLDSFSGRSSLLQGRASIEQAGSDDEDDEKDIESGLTHHGRSPRPSSFMPVWFVGLSIIVFLVLAPFIGHHNCLVNLLEGVRCEFFLTAGVHLGLLLGDGCASRL